MEEKEPMPWEHRLYEVPVIGGWSVEIWNPMAGEWQRSDLDPHWPASAEAEARRWVELMNEEQRERNESVLGSGQGYGF